MHLLCNRRFFSEVEKNTMCFPVQFSLNRIHNQVFLYMSSHVLAWNIHLSLSIATNAFRGLKDAIVFACIGQCLVWWSFDGPKVNVFLASAWQADIIWEKVCGGDLGVFRCLCNLEHEVEDKMFYWFAADYTDNHVHLLKHQPLTSSTGADDKLPGSRLLFVIVKSCKSEQ